MMSYNNPLIYVDQTGNVPQWLVDIWNQLKYEHRSVESTLSYWTLGMTDPFYTALRSPITSQEYWIAFTEATLNTGTMIMGGTLVKQGTSITVKITVTKGTSEATSLGFKSFNDLKKFLGSPGENKQWHHIVEQSQIKKSGFAPTLIHNTDNIIAIDSATYAQISGYYNSIDTFTNGLRVRDWLAGQSFEVQYQFGLDVLKRYGIKP